MGSSASGGVLMDFLSTEKGWAMRGGAPYLLLHAEGNVGKISLTRLKLEP